MVDRPGQFIWYELMTRDVQAAIAFYGTVIGWTARNSGIAGVDYWLWTAAGVEVGGLMAIPPEAAAAGMRPIWLGYIDVPAVDAAVADIVAAGGAVHMPAMDIADVGRMAMVADPQGAAFYVMTPCGAGECRSYAPGKPGHGGWHELHTQDGEAAFAFYSRQFGWAKSTAMDMGPMGTYQLFNAGGEAIGGMFNDAAFPRPAWVYYFNVDEITAARDRAAAAGGSIIVEPQEVPGNLWIIQGRDPQGALFALVGPKG